MSKLREIEDAMIRHPDPVVSVPELADELDRSTTHIRDQLRLLEREGVVTSKDVGARAVAWWHSERVAPPRLPPEEHPDQSDLESVESPDGAHSADLRLAEGLEEMGISRSAIDMIQSETQYGTGKAESALADLSALSNVDFPESRDWEDCATAVFAAREFLRDDGPATMREIVTTVGAEHPIGYDVPDVIEPGDRYRGAWWRHVVKPGLEALPDVEKPTSGASEWRVEE